MGDIRSFGEDGLVLAAEEPLAVLEARAEQGRAKGGLEEVMATPGALTVRYDPCIVSSSEAAALLEQLAEAPLPSQPRGSQRSITLPIRYDGPDLDAVAAGLSLAPEELIELHGKASYEVAFLGFTPGFAYLSGLDALLSPVRRLASPRVSVPAGSVGIAGGRCGVYALQGPGGWPIVGTTDAALFDPAADDPFTLRAGTRVRFVPA